MATVLSGCATLQLISFGVSGISYAVSGKSISDHAISKVMKKDCALHRIVFGENACLDPQNQLPSGVLLAEHQEGQRNAAPASDESHWHRVPEKLSLSKAPNQSQSKVQGNTQSNTAILAKHNAQNRSNKSGVRPGVKPSIKTPYQQTIAKVEPKTNSRPASKTASQTRPQRSRFNAKTSPEKLVNQLPKTMQIRGDKRNDHIVARRAAKRAKAQQKASYRASLLMAKSITSLAPLKVGAVDKPQLFAVIGSFNELAYARERISQYQHLNAQLMTTKRGATKYRVVVGPLSEQEFHQNMGLSAKSELNNAWRLRLCSNSLLPPPCDGSMLAKN